MTRHAPNHFQDALALTRPDYLENLTQAVRMHELAANLLAGEPAPVGDYHDLKEWQREAQYAIDSDDWSEFQRMLAVEDEWERYGHYADRHYGHPPLEFSEWARP